MKRMGDFFVSRFFGTRVPKVEVARIRKVIDPGVADALDHIFPVELTDEILGYLAWRPYLGCVRRSWYLTPKQDRMLVSMAVAMSRNISRNIGIPTI